MPSEVLEISGLDAWADGSSHYGPVQKSHRQGLDIATGSPPPGKLGHSDTVWVRLSLDAGVYLKHRVILPVKLAGSLATLPTVNPLDFRPLHHSVTHGRLGEDLGGVLHRPPSSQRGNRIRWMRTPSGCRGSSGLMSVW